MNDVERRKKIKEFINYWSSKETLKRIDAEEASSTGELHEPHRTGELCEPKIGERKEYQNFWNMLLSDIFEIRPYGFIEYEKSVNVEGNKKFIDGYIKETKVLIEQKGSNVDLDKPERQSGGIFLTPLEQGKRYSEKLPHNENPRWLITSNFKEIRIYDLNRTDNHFELIKLQELEKEWYRLKFLVNTKSDDIKKEQEISLEAGRLVGKLYDALYKQYKNIDDPHSQKSLNILCVRIVFCLYAEDAGLFFNKQMFYEYLKSFSEENFRDGLINLFKVLNQNENERDKYLKDSLMSFPYVNGGLFADTDVEVPTFNHEIIDLILNKMSENFDWSLISPTIFGAIFESTLNPETRRSGGMHYTSIENIHKVIDPLFLNDLKAEFNEIKAIKQKNTRNEKLKNFQNKISSLHFLDPATGSGNFLTETYRALRKIENEIIKLLYIGDKQPKGQIKLFDSFSEADKHNIIKVSIGQFYGIEINDFAVTVANTALWIAEYQALKETEDILNMQINFLPLKNYNHIIEGNALALDWKETLVSRTGELREPSINYIMGNPPFVGAANLTKIQKNEIMTLFKSNKHAGELDYVCGWYKKTFEFIKETNTKVAFVSTNSISQGEQVAALWKGEIEDNEINFAYRTFKWDSESSEKAKVHCVIIGFSSVKSNLSVRANYASPFTQANSISLKVIYDDTKPQIVSHINPYLIEGEDVLVGSRSKPICDVIPISKGCQPTDGGNLIIEEEDYNDFVKKEPKAKKYIKKLVGAKEYINNLNRYCLWLVDATPPEIKSMPLVLERIKKCKEMRLNSSDKTTHKLAERPHLFRETYNPKTYVIIPSTSSENRKYVPIGFLDENTISTNANLIIPEAPIYYFGILTSNVHMAWMRAVAGRLKSDYRYSKDIVYNNFPWPDVLYEGSHSSPIRQSSPSSPIQSGLAKLRSHKEFEEHKKKIEETAKAILDIRAKFPDSSLADLYDDTTMPDTLRKAHRENDKAVMNAYGFKISYTEFSENDCVTKLMKLYKKLTEPLKN